MRNYLSNSIRRFDGRPSEKLRSLRRSKHSKGLAFYGIFVEELMKIFVRHAGRVKIAGTQGI